MARADPCWQDGDYQLATGRSAPRFVEEPGEFGAVLRRCGAFTQVWTMKPGIHDTLRSISDALVAGSGNFNRGVYVLMVAPSIVRRFAKEGWALADVRD